MAFDKRYPNRKDWRRPRRRFDDAIKQVNADALQGCMYHRAAQRDCAMCAAAIRRRRRDE
jgi:hypothetical protein